MHLGHYLLHDLRLQALSVDALANLQRSKLAARAPTDLPAQTAVYNRLIRDTKLFWIAMICERADASNRYENLPYWQTSNRYAPRSAYVDTT